MEPTISELPFVTCLCPTFHRPKLLANALACYLAQDYPADRRELIILDDGQDFAPDQRGDNWQIYAVPTRFPSLPDKFNAAAKLRNRESTALIVWEDDDIYLPHHISSHVAAMQQMEFPLSAFSKPSTVLSTYPGHVVLENAAGRFHASIAFRLDLFDHVGGWPLTKRADFDQQFMSLLAKNVRHLVADPCTIAPPSYCFRYGSTQAYHGQHFMQSPDDEGWYDRVPRRPGNGDLILFPQFDDETRMVYAQCAAVPAHR